MPLYYVDGLVQLLPTSCMAAARAGPCFGTRILLAPCSITARCSGNRTSEPWQLAVRCRCRRSQCVAYVLRRRPWALGLKRSMAVWRPEMAAATRSDMETPADVAYVLVGGTNGTSV